MAPFEPPATTQPPGPFEHAFVVVALLAFTLGPVYQLRVRYAGPLTVPDLIDDQFVQAVFAGLYGITIALVARRAQMLTRATALVFGSGIFSMVVLVSTFWSHDRGRTLAQAVLLAGTSTFGLYLGVRFPVRSQIRMIFVAMQLGALMSVVAILRHWTAARDIHGAWAGIYFNRNSLGPVAIVGFMAGSWLVVDQCADRRRSSVGWTVAAVVGAALDVRLEWGSRSLTPLLGLGGACGTAVTAFALALLVRSRRLRQPVANGLLVGLAALVAAAFALGWQRFSLAIGRSSTLESRTPLWHLVLDTWRVHPVRGIGWMSAWTDAAFQDKVRTVANVPLPSAHNGYLEVLLGTGIVGVLALAGVLVPILRRTWRVDPSITNLMALWPLALVAYCLTVNLMESFIGANLLVWVLLLAAGSTAHAARSTLALPLESDGLASVGLTSAGLPKG